LAGVFATAKLEERSRASFQHSASTTRGSDSNQVPNAAAVHGLDGR